MYILTILAISDYSEPLMPICAMFLTFEFDLNRYSFSNREYSR